VALTVSDGFDGPPHLPSDHCDFHSGIKQRLQFFVLHPRPRAAGWAGGQSFSLRLQRIDLRTDIPDFLKNVVALLARRKLASGRKHLRRHIFHFFQFFQSRRSHFFTSGPALDKAAEAVLINPKVPASEIFPGREVR
jgi:hypothetical protein